MKILVINGPNMNLLGQREPELYGTETYRSLCCRIRRYAKEKGIRVRFFQSNHEGAIIDRIQKAGKRYQAIIINPAAYAHTSIAIADALNAVALPAVEVHMTAVEEREDYRKVSYLRDVCRKTVSGKGIPGYCEAIDFLLKERQ